MNREVNCDYCGEPAELVTGREVYPHRPDLYKKQIWRCKPCEAYVGCYGGSDKPMGRLANEMLREMKMAAHKIFDRKWKVGHMTRSEAYAWLSEKLGVPIEKCHIGMFDVDDCKRVVAACKRRRR